MSDVDYLKCPCKECGNNIEFPPSAKGTTVVCPHCGQWTELLVPESPRKKKSFEFGLAAQAATFVLLLLVIAGGIAFARHKQHTAQASPEKSPVKLAAVPMKKTAPTPLPATNKTTLGTNAPAKPALPRPKSPDDFKISAIQIEKTQGSSLIYAVGTVKNDSDHDRYGVRIELDAFNKKGAKVAEAKDYKDYLAPHQEWLFHALIPDSKAATAKVASLKEDQ